MRKLTAIALLPALLVSDGTVGPKFIGIIALWSGAICGIGSNWVIFQMVDRVNERLPGEQSFASLGWYWSKYRRLFGEYKKLYPDGNLVQRFRSLTDRKSVV